MSMHMYAAFAMQDEIEKKHDEASGMTKNEIKKRDRERRERTDLLFATKVDDSVNVGNPFKRSAEKDPEGYNVPLSECLDLTKSEERPSETPRSILKIWAPLP